MFLTDKKQGHFVVKFSIKRRLRLELRCDDCTCNVQFGSEYIARFSRGAVDESLPRT